VKAHRSLLRALLPLQVRNRIRDSLESAKRIAERVPRARPELGLSVTQLYPPGRHLLSVLEQATAEKLLGLELRKDTPVASIGTCFAEEFYYCISAKGFNYVRTEPGTFPASANWGRVYTIPGLLQIVRYSTEHDFPLTVEESRGRYFDPCREHATLSYSSVEEAGAAILAHRAASREAFRKSEILIITVGQNEAWVDSKNGLVWGRIPPKDVLQSRSGDFRVREFSYDENREALEESIERLLTLNPKLRFLLTVSPVASYATFCDSDVVTQSFANKCVLRAVVHDVVNRRRGIAFYFPSFEIVLCDNPRNFRADNRHVKHSAVDRIFLALKRAAHIQ